jgi:hypothetical protein
VLQVKHKKSMENRTNALIFYFTKERMFPYNNYRGDIMVDYVLKNSLHDHIIVTIMY